jgi:hypothetical protein
MLFSLFSSTAHAFQSFSSTARRNRKACTATSSLNEHGPLNTCTYAHISQAHGRTQLQDFYGLDELQVYVVDLGNTDECYNNSLTAYDVVNIRVVAVNDKPIVSYPGAVLPYQGRKCDVKFHVYPNGELILVYCACLWMVICAAHRDGHVCRALFTSSANVRLHIYIYIYIYIFVCVLAHVHTCIYTHIYTYTYTYTHTHT